VTPIVRVIGVLPDVASMTHHRSRKQPHLLTADTGTVLGDKRVALGFETLGWPPTVTVTGGETLVVFAGRRSRARKVTVMIDGGGSLHNRHH
jgi:hypothetical protein